MRQEKYRFLLLPLIFVLACVGALAQANSESPASSPTRQERWYLMRTSSLIDPATGASEDHGERCDRFVRHLRSEPRKLQHESHRQGLRVFAQNGIVVNVSSTARVDIKLTVGAESQTVTVEADALAVQADSNVVSTLISSEQISQIATENRNFAALAALGLGVSSALPDSNTPTSVAANFTISVNGLRQSHNIWLIDGGEADDRGGAGGMDIMPSQDAIAEFTVMTLELSAGLRYFFRRHHEPFAQERHAEVPWHAVRVQPQHRLRRQQLLQQDDDALPRRARC